MVAPPPEANQVGGVLSRRFRLIRKLGEGGMGEVYAADPIDGGMRVAIKILRREFISDGLVRSRFLEEGRTCMRLQHPNVARVLECALAEDGAPYLVLELLEGVPLGAYMQNGARVPVAQAAPILQGILSGLGAAHAQKIVHRDLKPDNVFLTRGPNGTFVVKVLDFGIAKVMDAAGGMGNRTRSGVLLGTPAYMSPEQARSARDVDERADLWSVGVLFYEMLTGRVAFPAPTEYARLAALLSAEPQPLEQVDSAFAPLAPFVSRALKKNREERFATAHEMARALAAVAPSGSLRPPEAPAAEAAAPALSRLPQVPSLLAPVQGVTAPPRPAPTASPTSPGASQSSWEPAVRGTLASPAAPMVADPAPQVPFVERSALGGTLPSKGRDASSPLSGRRAVSRTAVVVLVVCALAVGFVLGWVVGRATGAPRPASAWSPPQASGTVTS